MGTVYETHLLENVHVDQAISRLGFSDLSQWQQWNGLKPDGIYGPISNHALTKRLTGCGVPDVLSDEALQAIGRGSWPQPCQKGGVLIHVDESGLPDQLRPHWPRVVQTVFASYASIGLKMALTSDRSRCQITVDFVRPSGGWIGLAEFNNQSCSDRVFNRLSKFYLPSAIFDQWCRLFAHELGHNCNLPHTNGGVMNPVILSGTYTSWQRSDPSWSRLAGYFGGEPIDEPKPPKPPETPKVIATFEVPVAGAYQIVAKSDNGGIVI